MRTKYIIQIKRRYYWEDVLSYIDKQQCFVSYLKLLGEGRNVRVVELHLI